MVIWREGRENKSFDQLNDTILVLKIEYCSLNLYQSTLHERVNQAVFRYKDHGIQTPTIFSNISLFQTLIHDIRNINDKFLLKNQFNSWQVYKIHPFTCKFEPQWGWNVTSPPFLSNKKCTFPQKWNEHTFLMRWYKVAQIVDLWAKNGNREPGWRTHFHSAR